MLILTIREFKMTTHATLNEIQELFLCEMKGVPNANKIAARFLDSLKNRFAGETLYIPKGGISKRNNEIRALFDGLNHRELAAAYNLTQRQIRVILNGKI